MKANYILRAVSGTTEKKALDIVVARTVQAEGGGRRKFHYYAFLSEAGGSLKRPVPFPEKEIRIRIPGEAKPSFAKQFLYSPQRFLMLRARLDGRGRATAINSHEDYGGATSPELLQSVFKAVLLDLEGEGALSLNMGMLRKGRRSGIPLERIAPLVDARIRASGHALESRP